jgi:hypothetical protein
MRRKKKRGQGKEEEITAEMMEVLETSGKGSMVTGNGSGPKRGKMPMSSNS